MRKWKETVRSPEFQRLWHSLDMQYIGFRLLIAGIAVVLLDLILLVCTWITGESAAVILWFLLILLPFLVWAACRTIQIFRHMDDYTFTEVILSSPNSGLSRQSPMSFAVIVWDRDGERTAVDTSYIFSPGSLGFPSLEEYINKSVTVGYNNSTGNVVVIG